MEPLRRRPEDPVFYQRHIGLNPVNDDAQKMQAIQDSIDGWDGKVIY